MLKSCFLFCIIAACAVCLHAQINKNYVPCNDMPNIMQNYYADIWALNRVYIVDGSPEKRERYKKVAVEYLGRLKQLDFNSLPQECKADYILFKRDLNEAVYDAETEAKEFNALQQWFPFADSIYVLEK